MLQLAVFFFFQKWGELSCTRSFSWTYLWVSAKKTAEASMESLIYARLVLTCQAWQAVSRAKHFPSFLTHIIILSVIYVSLKCRWRYRSALKNLQLKNSLWIRRNTFFLLFFDRFSHTWTLLFQTNTDINWKFPLRVRSKNTASLVLLSTLSSFWQMHSLKTR